MRTKELSERKKLAAMPDDAILQTPDICRFAQFSRTTLWRLYKRGEGPPRFKWSDDGPWHYRLGEVRKWWANKTGAGDDRASP